VANSSSNDVSVIRTFDNTVIATVDVGGNPLAFGIFIQGTISPRPPSNVPTLSEWGLIVMASILGIVGFMVMRRRKVTA
jgi:YVTN family beta-propeller protein